jgi:adenosine deaminase
VFPTLAEHALPRMIDEGLYVTINSDDPPMFNTTLTAEYLVVADTFGFDVDIIEGLVLNALRAIFLPVQEKAAMEAQFASEFGRLRAAYLND